MLHTNKKRKKIILSLLVMMISIYGFGYINSIHAISEQPTNEDELTIADGDVSTQSEFITMKDQFELLTSEGEVNFYDHYLVAGSGVLTPQDRTEMAVISSKNTYSLNRSFEIEGTFNGKLQPDGYAFGIYDGSITSDYKEQAKIPINLGVYNILKSASFVEIDFWKNHTSENGDGNVGGSHDYNPHVYYSKTDENARYSGNTVLTEYSGRSFDSFLEGYRNKFLFGLMTFKIEYNAISDVISYSLVSNYQKEVFRYTERGFKQRYLLEGGSENVNFFVSGTFNNGETKAPYGRPGVTDDMVGGWVNMSIKSVKYSDLKPITSVINQVDDGNNKLYEIDNTNYTTYAVPGDKIRQIYKITNNSASGVPVPYQLNHPSTSNAMHIRSYITTDINAAPPADSITNTGTITIPALLSPIYIISEYNVFSGSSSIIDLDSSLFLGRVGDTQFEQKGTIKVAGMPILKLRNYSAARIYATGEFPGRSGIPEAENYIGVIGSVSGNQVEKDFTGKTPNDYNNGAFPIYLIRNAIHDLDNNISIPMQPNYEIPNAKGRYRLTLGLNDMSFNHRRFPFRSEVLSRYYAVLESNEFTDKLDISDDRTQYLDVKKDVTIDSSDANDFINAGMSKFKQAFGIDAKQVGNVGILKEIDNVDIGWSFVDNTTLENAKKGVPGVYPMTFTTTKGCIVNRNLIVYPDGVWSADSTQLLTPFKGTIIEQKDAVGLFNDQFKKISEYTGVKAYQKNTTDQTLSEAGFLLETVNSSGVFSQVEHDQLENGEVGVYRLTFKSMGSNATPKPNPDNSQAVLPKQEFFMIAPTGSSIAANQVYIYAKNKVMDSKKIAFDLKDKSDIEVEKYLKSIMNVWSKEMSGYDSVARAKVSIVSGGTLADIKAGKIGKYKIAYEHTYAGQTAKIEKDLHIIDNNATWGISIPKSAMLTDNKLSNEKEIEIFAKAPYTKDDFADDFKVRVGVTSDNNYKLKRVGDTNETDLNVGLYQTKYQLKTDANVLVGAAEIISKNGAGNVNAELNSQISKATPKMKMDIEMLKEPKLKGQFVDILRFTFDMEGVAIPPEKVK